MACQGSSDSVLANRETLHQNAKQLILARCVAQMFQVVLPIISPRQQHERHQKPALWPLLSA